MFLQVLAHSKPCLFSLDISWILVCFWIHSGTHFQDLFKNSVCILVWWCSSMPFGRFWDASGQMFDALAASWMPLGSHFELWNTTKSTPAPPLERLCHFWGLSGSLGDTSGLALDALGSFGAALGSHFELICHGIHLFFTHIFRTW